MDSTDPGHNPRMKGSLMRRATRAPFVFGAAVVLLLGIGAGVAYGYFTSTGTGAATAKVGKLTAVTLIPTTGTPSSLLYPGGTANVLFTVDNTNNYSVTIVSVTLNTGHSITASGGKGTCNGTGGVTFSPYSGSPISVPAHTSGGSSFQVTLTAAASMSASSTTGCQTATFSIPVKITVEKR